MREQSFFGGAKRRMFVCQAIPISAAEATLPSSAGVKFQLLQFREKIEHSQRGDNVQQAEEVLDAGV